MASSDPRSPDPATAGPFARRLSRRAFLGLLAGGGAAAVAGTGIAATYRFEVERLDVPLVGLRAPVRVAWLCDMHYGPFVGSGSVAAWVDAALAEAPDLVLLGGDIVDSGAPNDVRSLLDELERLRAPLGVFAVRGNHEYLWRGDLPSFERDLAAIGVRVLVNRGLQLRDDLFYAGLDAARVGQGALRSALGGRPVEACCLSGSHKPAVLVRVPETVQLTLCGHTHGGQVRIPGIGAVTNRSGLGREHEAGWVRAPALGYVSRGLGVVHVPFRFDCPAELTIVDLTSA